MKIKYPSVPTCCGECPCLHYENPMYCQAVVHDPAKRVIAPYRSPRPDWCPIEKEENNG